VDLLSFKLHLPRHHVRALVADAAGVRAADLDGERAARVLAAARPLLEAVARAAGAPVRALSLDPAAEVARASLSPGGAAVLRGPDYRAATATLADVARALLLEIRPRAPLPPGSPSDESFWSGVYQRGRDGWELGRATPPLARFLTANPGLVAGRGVLVVGCGRGHEARLAARLGARVTAVDIAPEAIEDARRRADLDTVSIDFRRRDLFDLPRAPERWDLVLEHCCFCAIDPARRPEYVRAMAAVLAPRGALAGLFWAHGREGGPPFSTTRAEIASLFAADFETELLEIPPDSVAARQGQELLALLRRKT
jgi:SAM-dependent methyltransferase